MSLPTSVTELLQPFKTDVIAEACDISFDTVRSWRNGETVPPIDKLESLSALTRLSIPDITVVLIEDNKIPRRERMARAKAMRIRAVA